jgi:UDPglucose 6-dehydrogenase
VYEVTDDIAQYPDGYTAIVDKSTVPIVTVRQVHRINSTANPDADFVFALNPGFFSH